MKEEKYNLKTFRLRALLKKKSPDLYKKYENIWDFSINNFLKFMNIDNYTDHGENHVIKIEKIIFNLMTKETKDDLSDFEIFCLLVSCCLHDIGMIVKSGSNETNSKTRLEHHKRVKDLLESKYREFQLNQQEGHIIGIICYGHGIPNLSELGAYDNWSIDPYGKINALFLAALLRVGDLIDLTFLRAPKLVADLKKIKDVSLNHWKLQNKISDVKTDCDKGEITIYATSDNEYDLSELYKLRNYIQGEIEIVKAALKQKNILFNSVKLKTNLDRKRVLSIENPFIRLESFNYEQHTAFFGREKETLDLYKKIIDNKLSVLVGESGVGKTSLLEAGVKQKLIEDGYYVFTIRSSDNFQEVLYKALKREFINYHSKDLFALLEKMSCEGFKIVIFYDQFEEIFTFQNDSLEHKILTFYKSILSNNDINLRSVLSIRDDFLARMWDLSNEVPAFYERKYTYRLKQLNIEQASQAITNTLKHIDYAIEDALVNKLLDEFTQEEGTIYPPFIQIVCHKLFDNHKIKYKEISKKTIINQADYVILGGSQKIISEYFEEILDGFSFKQREVINDILIKMITHFETKQRITKVKILKINDSRTDIDLILNRLITHRIIRKIESEEYDEYEIIHDFLARKIIDNKNVIVSSKIKKALNYIEDNYDKQIKLEYVAKQVNATKEHFCRLFKKETGSNFIEYINNKRIKEAQRILENPSITIIEICKRVGIPNPQHFSKVFKQIVKSSPTAYRESILN